MHSIQFAFSIAPQRSSSNLGKDHFDFFAHRSGPGLSSFGNDLASQDFERNEFPLSASLSLRRNEYDAPPRAAAFGLGAWHAADWVFRSIYNHP